MSTVHDTPPSPSPAPEAWTVEALRTVWEHQRGRLQERIAVVEWAVAALAADDLDAPLQDEAVRAAHMLAGSVGTFGFLAASEAARALESGLTCPAPADAAALSQLVIDLRRGVRGEVALHEDAHTLSGS